VATCRDCGKGLGLRGRLTRATTCDDCLDRRIVEEERREAEAMVARQRLPAILAAAAADGVVTPEEEAEIRALMQRGNIDAFRRAEVAMEMFRARYQRVVADGVVTDEELVELLALGDGLGVPGSQLIPEMQTLHRLRTLSDIEAGRLPVIEGSSLMTKRGELVHAEVAAGIIEEKTFRQRVGRNSGFSVRLAKGLTYHVQATAPRTVSHQAFVVTDNGRLAITNQRVAYMSPRKSFSVPYAKLMGLEVFSDALLLNSESRQAPYIVQVADTQMATALIGKASTLALG
jgi:hypothetical protein